MPEDVITEGQDGIQTCDLYLAAFFSAAGCNMVKASREPRSKRVYFVFEKTPVINDLRVTYFSREAKVSALTFADNIKSLKSLCHNLITGVGGST